MQASRTGEQPQSYTAIIPMNHKNWHKNPNKDAVVAGTYTLALTNSSLAGFKTHSTRGKPCLELDNWKTTQC